MANKMITVYNKRFNCYERVERPVPIKTLRAVCKAQDEAIKTEQRYNAQNVCCGFVLPTNGICPECGKHHKIKF